MPKYVATRKDVCAGQLLKTCEMSSKISDSNNNEVSQEQLEERGISFSVFVGLVCRGMLFNLNEDGLAHDLMYTTPNNYPIIDKKTEIDIESEFVIDRYVELEELLKYLKYGIDLTQNDLNQIYRKLIIHREWLDHHMELFGFEKMDNGMGYVGGGIQTIPKKIYDNLNIISCSKNGRPYREEPSYSLIKKRR